MDLKDPNARIFLFKVKHDVYFYTKNENIRPCEDILLSGFVSQDGVMVPFNTATDEKHFLRQVGRKFVFSVNGLSAEDAGMYQVDVEGVNVFSTDFKSEF